MPFARNGHYPIADIIRRLLTGYVLAFNRRHSLDGVLLQNRYKSVLLKEEPYLPELAHYIHLKHLQCERHVVMVPQIRITHHLCASQIVQRLRVQENAKPASVLRFTPRYPVVGNTPSF